MKAWLTFLFVASATVASAGGMAMPSGQLVTPYETLWEDHSDMGETWLVLRFLAPDIARETGLVMFADAAPDMDHLCAEVGLPLAAITSGGVDQILVTLMDTPIKRGVSDQAVTQFFSAYRVDTWACIWE